MSSRNDMPTREAIHKYWLHGQGRMTLESNGVQLIEQHSLVDELNRKRKVILTCFACGEHTNLQRCHIVPLNAGGDNSLANLHLLCSRCHTESESYVGDLYWRWLKHQTINEWRHYVEHSYQRMEKVGYDEREFFRILSNSGTDAALDYCASFMSFSSAEERQEFFDACKSGNVKE